MYVRLYSFVPFRIFQMQVPIVGLEDKRQITALLSINLAGQLLPPQEFNFPEEWDIHHSETHWSNAATMDRYADKIVIPYLTAQREALGLPDQPALAIFNVYKAHCCPALSTTKVEGQQHPPGVRAR